VGGCGPGGKGDFNGGVKKSLLMKVDGLLHMLLRAMMRVDRTFLHKAGLDAAGDGNVSSRE
jgi:hypothetical protein